MPVDRSEQQCVTTLIKALASFNRLQDLRAGPMAAQVMQALLDAIQEAGETFQISRASREHRHKLTVNYQASFPYDAQAYNIDLFCQSMHHDMFISTNGTAWELGPAVCSSRSAFQESWTKLCKTLKRDSPLLDAVFHEKVCSALTRLDAAWAEFDE